MSLKILFLISEDWFFCSHFIERAAAARAAGYQVVVVTRERLHGQVIRDAGLRLVPIEFERRSTHLWRELKLLSQLRSIYADEKPDIVHHIAAKPIFYGTLVSRLLRIRAVVNAPVGMGYVFTSSAIKARLLRPLIRLAYHLLLNPRGSRVVFENSDDLASFVNSGAVQAKSAEVVRGAGINLAMFRPQEPPPGPPVVMLVARMLRDKGIVEFVSAARILHQAGVRARFVLVGDPDPGNPASISAATLASWHGRHGLEHWGWRNDVVAALKQAHIACLPSYREGLPKSLLEAAASGLPIVTTNTVGCRDVVQNGFNGLLVPVRSVDALAAALRQLIQDPDLRQSMGINGRQLAEREFSSDRIIAETLAIYEKVAGSKPMIINQHTAER